MGNVSLGELVDQCPVWLNLNARQLARALASSTEKARDLRKFFGAAEAWWAEDGISNSERRSRREWLDGAAADFLRELKPEGVMAMADELSDLDVQLNFLADMANRDAGRYLILSALEVVISRIAREVPRTRPDPEDVERWTRRCLRLCDLLGSSPGQSSERFARALDALPEWLLEAFLQAIGRLDHYDNYYRELSCAFGLAKSGDVARVLARVGSGARTSRQTEMLSVLARQSQDDFKQQVLPGDLSPSVARDFLRRVEAEVPEALREPFGLFLDSQRGYGREISRILSDYLSAVPRNHEDVIDFLTRHGTRQRGRALGSWGSPSVTITEYGSMRLHSPFYRGALDSDAPSPDFDCGDTLKAVPKESVVALIKAQRDPMFSLEYATIFSNHPDYAVIAEAIVRDPDCAGRWEHAGPKYAIYIWDRLDLPAYKAPAFEALRMRLLPVLLPEFETSALPRALQLLPEEFHAVARQDVLARLKHGPQIRDLDPLFHAGAEVGITREELIDELDTAELARVPAEPKDRAGWIKDMSELLESTAELAELVLASIDPAEIEGLARDSGLEASPFTARGQLMLKTHLVKRWAARDPDSVAVQLEASGQDDFDLFWLAGLDAEPWDHELEPVGPADRWLDMIASTVPSLVVSYAVAMIKLAPAARDQNVRHTISAFGRALVRWLCRRELETPDAVWNAAQNRITKATGEADIETAATVAALDLPGDPARLRSLRERAAREISAVLGHGYHEPSPVTGALDRFIRVLAIDAPELTSMLSRR